MLIAERLQMDADSARLADFLWHGPGPDLALWRPASRDEDWVTVSWIEGDRRTVVQIRRRHRAPVDRLHFELGEERFIERDDAGEVLFDLPAVMQVGVPTEAGVTLEHVGPVRFTLGSYTEELRCIGLGHGAKIQWLAEGIGELWLGERRGPPARWVIGWDGGGRRLFGGVR